MRFGTKAILRAMPRLMSVAALALCVYFVSAVGGIALLKGTFSNVSCID